MGKPYHMPALLLAHPAWGWNRGLALPAILVCMIILMMPKVDSEEMCMETGHSFGDIAVLPGGSGESLHQGVYEWSIPNFSTLHDVRMYSPKFEIGGHVWRVLMRNKANNLSVYLDSAFGTEIIWREVNFKLIILHNQDPSLSFVRETRHIFTAHEPDWGFTMFHKLDDILARDSPWLSEDTLYLQIDLDVYQDANNIYNKERATPRIDRLPADAQRIYRLSSSNALRKDEAVTDKSASSVSGHPGDPPLASPPSDPRYSTRTRRTAAATAAARFPTDDIDNSQNKGSSQQGGSSSSSNSSPSRTASSHKAVASRSRDFTEVAFVLLVVAGAASFPIYTAVSRWLKLNRRVAKQQQHIRRSSPLNVIAATAPAIAAPRQPLWSTLSWISQIWPAPICTPTAVPQPLTRLSDKGESIDEFAPRSVALQSSGSGVPVSVSAPSTPVLRQSGSGTRPLLVNALESAALIAAAGKPKRKPHQSPMTASTPAGSIGSASQGTFQPMRPGLFSSQVIELINGPAALGSKNGVHNSGFGIDIHHTSIPDDASGHNWGGPAESSLNKSSTSASSFPIQDSLNRPRPLVKPVIVKSKVTKPERLNLDAGHHVVPEHKGANPTAPALPANLTPVHHTPYTNPATNRAAIIREPTRGPLTPSSPSREVNTYFPPAPPSPILASSASRTTSRRTSLQDHKDSAAATASGTAAAASLGSTAVAAASDNTSGLQRSHSLTTTHTQTLHTIRGIQIPTSVVVQVPSLSSQPTVTSPRQQQQQQQQRRHQYVSSGAVPPVATQLQSSGEISPNTVRVRSSGQVYPSITPPEATNMQTPCDPTSPRQASSPREIGPRVNVSTRALDHGKSSVPSSHHMVTREGMEACIAAGWPALPAAAPSASLSSSIPAPSPGDTLAFSGSRPRQAQLQSTAVAAPHASPLQQRSVHPQRAPQPLQVPELVQQQQQQQLQLQQAISSAQRPRRSSSPSTHIVSYDPQDTARAASAATAALEVPFLSSLSSMSPTRTTQSNIAAVAQVPVPVQSFSLTDAFEDSKRLDDCAPPGSLHTVASIGASSSETAAHSFSDNAAHDGIVNTALLDAWRVLVCGSESAHHDDSYSGSTSVDLPSLLTILDSACHPVHSLVGGSGSGSIAAAATMLGSPSLFQPSPFCSSFHSDSASRQSGRSSRVDIPSIPLLQAHLSDSIPHFQSNFSDPWAAQTPESLLTGPSQSCWPTYGVMAHSTAQPSVPPSAALHPYGRTFALLSEPGMDPRLSQGGFKDFIPAANPPRISNPAIEGTPLNPVLSSQHTAVQYTYPSQDTPQTGQNHPDLNQNLQYHPQQVPPGDFRVSTPLSPHSPIFHLTHHQQPVTRPVPTHSLLLAPTVPAHASQTHLLPSTQSSHTLQSPAPRQAQPNPNASPFRPALQSLPQGIPSVGNSMGAFQPSRIQSDPQEERGWKPVGFPDSIPGSTDEPSLLGSTDLCVLCCRNPVEVGLLHSLTSAVHYCVCRNCAAAEGMGAGFPCPVCKQNVDQAVHVFVVR